MGEKYPRWAYVVIFALLAIVVVLAGKSLIGYRSEGVGLAPPPEQSAKELADKDKQMQALDSEVAQLRKELEANSGRVKELESRLDETNKAFSAAQQKLKVAQKQAKRLAAAPPPAKEKTVARNVEPSPPPAWRRPAEPGIYEVIRDTAVLEKPSASSREVAMIQKGTTVNVVGSQGEWLEVRSKYGKPPGFIRRDDAMFRAGQSERR